MAMNRSRGSQAELKALSLQFCGGARLWLFSQDMTRLSISFAVQMQTGPQTTNLIV